jgi:hypothetical protein
MGFAETTGMRLGVLTVMVMTLGLVACGKSQPAANASADNSAAAQAAADASNVTSIPGYAPPTGNAAGNTRP